MTRAQTDLNTTSLLTAREVCQILTDVALGKRIMMRRSSQSWVEIYHGLIPVEIDGWVLTLFNDCDTLDYCDYCRSPDGRVGTFELWQREGADPVELLSARELERSDFSEPSSLRLLPLRITISLLFVITLMQFMPDYFLLTFDYLCIVNIYLIRQILLISINQNSLTLQIKRYIIDTF